MIYHLRLQPSEIEALFYYEYWYFIKDLSKLLEEKNKENAKAEEQAQGYSLSKQSMQPKVPSVKMPSIKMPSL